MVYSSVNRVLVIVLVMWGFTLLRSLLIMLCGKKIFVKAAKGEKTAFYPVLNLFTMLEVCDISSFWGILLFVPVLNFVVLFMMSWKLGGVFHTGTGFKVGLVILPIMFYPLIAISDKPYKVTDHDYFKALDSARGESINLMTEDEVQQANEVEDTENNVEVDSIFKSNVQLMEKVEPYKAAKINLLDMEKLKEKVPDDNPLDKIHRQEEPAEKKTEEFETLDL